MDRAGLITLEQARAAGLSFDEPEPRTCPHCGAALDPLGAALAGKVAWVSAAPCPCEGAARERETEERRRAALAAKEEAARREKALSRAGIPRRYWAAEADRPEFAYRESFASTRELQVKLSDYVHWYNNFRIHSTLGYMSPVEFRKAGLAL